MDALTEQLLREEIAELEAKVERMEEALLIIAGKKQCLDNTMSNAQVARAALENK